MLKIIKNTITAFVVITVMTSLLTLFGIFYMWFFNNNQELLFIRWLIGSVIIEIVTVVILYVKYGLKYLPSVEVNKIKDKTNLFMEKFISTGTSATIVSNRLSWLTKNRSMIDMIKIKIKEGIKIEIITPKPLDRNIMSELKGVSFFVTNEDNPPEARFTLINGERGGAEKLAISKGVHPEHEITIFDSFSGPQIIAMAKDIILKSKRLNNDRLLD